MNTLLRSALVAVVAVGLLSCEARTDRTDTGGVLLTISAVNGLPFGVSMNTPSTSTIDTNLDGQPDFVVIGNLTLRSIVADPSGTTSDLMSIELKSYQVVYRRIDGGTAVPAPLTGDLFGHILPPGGTDAITNLPLLGTEQLGNRPLKDLLFINGGREQGTGNTTIRLGMLVTFFGKTLGGKDVSTVPQDWTIDITR